MGSLAQTVFPPAGGRGASEASRVGLSRAQELRNRATISEKRLWLALRGRKLAGAKFSRQMPVGPYFADFLCREHALIVEVDGHAHDFTIDHERRRTAWLQAQGYCIVRCTNDEVTFGLELVLERIAEALPTPPPTAGDPPARGREDN